MSDDLNRWLADREACGFSKASKSNIQAFQEMLGRRYGSLVVVSYEQLRLRPDGKGADIVWRCRCDCGGEKSARQMLLRAGDTKNCGKCLWQVQVNLPEVKLRKLALTLEFEGTVGVYSTGPRIVVPQRVYARVLLDLLAEEIGLGKVTQTIEREICMAQWQVGGAEAVQLAKAVLPFMVCKREQAKIVSEFVLGTRGEKNTPEVQLARKRACVLTNQLNERGPKEADAAWAARANDWRKWVYIAKPEERAEILAWSVEWEGNLGVYESTSKASARGARHGVGIGVTQSSHRRCLLDIVRWLSGGIGSISGPIIDPRPGNSPRSFWTVNSIREAKILAVDLHPHLIGKRRLAELVAEFPECDTKPVPEGIFQRRRALAQESKKLNAVDPLADYQPDDLNDD